MATVHWRQRPERGPMRVRLGALAQRIDPWMLVVVSVGAALRFSRLGDFDNQYYTATVVSMLKSPRNFLFASFDPAGVVAVDKPPFSFWVQAIPVALFGPSRWAVAFPQALAGTFAVATLYLVIRPALGRMAAVAAAVVLAVVPASVIIDSGNEPDSLLSLMLLLAAACIIRAARTGQWRWLVAFAVFMGIGFNTKMLVAFVPLPIFLGYYILAADQPFRRVVLRAASASALLLAISFAWVTLVAMTPPDDRPYVGSTQDNSIWTLVFKYNGLDRFTSFIGPRPQGQALPAVRAGQGVQTPYSQPPYSQPQAVPAGTIASDEAGILSLFSDRLAGQTGWLLPLAFLMLPVIFVPLLIGDVYRQPSRLRKLLRDTPSASQTLLWGAWFLTAVVVFGSASATITHPYYLVGLAVPLAAVLGIALALLRRVFLSGNLLSWLVPGMVVGGVAYQATNAHELVGEWAIVAALVVTPMAVLGMAVAIWRRATATVLASAFVAMGALSVLLLPAALTLIAGGPMAGPNASLSRQPAPLSPEGGRVRRVLSYVTSDGYAGSDSALGALSAHQAAPFIIAGVPAVAIGGFSGRDPIFSLDSFRAVVERGRMRYFLMPDQSSPGAAAAGPGRSHQQRILEYIRRDWEDVSRDAGLPSGTLYRWSLASAQARRAA